MFDKYRATEFNLYSPTVKLFFSDSLSNLKTIFISRVMSKKRSYKFETKF